MWFSARIAGVTDANLARSFLATIGVSVVTGASLTAIQALPTPGAIILGLVALFGSVAIIRSIFRTKTQKALLIWLVNVMVQILIVSFYYRAVLPPLARP